MKRILPLLLCLSLLMLGGCGSEPGVQTPDPAFSMILDLDYLHQPILDTSLKTVDLTSTDREVTAQLTQTLGDAMNLYLVGFITFPQDLPEDVSSPLPKAVTISENGNVLTHANRHVGVSPAEGKTDTLNFILYFGFDREVFRGQELTLDIQDCLGYDFSFTWPVTNEGPIRYADVKDAEGNMVGTLNLSTYALNVTLWGSPFESDNDLWRNIAMLDENGGLLSNSKMSLSGSSSTLHLGFYQPRDPAITKTVQIGPYTAELG